MKTVIKKSLSGTLRTLLGRERMAHLGRFIRNEARLDGTNNFECNGELLVQDCLVRLAKGRERCTVLDIGANVGIWSQEFVGRFQPAGVPFTVYAFEPFPGTFATLSGNVRQWGLDEVVKPQNVALSSRGGEQTFYSLGVNQGRNSLHPQIHEQSEQVHVKCMTLDEWCAEAGVQSVFFAKIDTEGNDYEVMSGARGLLDSGRIEMLQFEYNHCWIVARRFLLDAFELLLPRGYKLGKITRIGIEFYNRWDRDLETFQEGNYLVTRPEHASAFPTVSYWK